jgi:omega-6 fatty acid desaturase (delta-12 desaturase)
MSTGNSTKPQIDWNAMLAPYRKPEAWRSIFQLANTLLPFAVLWALALWSLDVSYWLTLALTIPAAMLLVRLFMFQHDCGHMSFFRSQRACNAVGSVLGVLTLVPYAYWRKTHAIHHANSGNLEMRGFGDIDTLTVREYLSRSWFQRAFYRVYRNPLILLTIGPFQQFVVKHRFPTDLPRDWKREWKSVHRTNLALLSVIVAMGLLIGFDRFLMVQVPISLIAGSIGIYLFYVQHQYEDTYWRYREAWNYYEAGLEGASHLVMPKVLQWFTANIGLHHIHHVASRIPNYHLQRAFNENPPLQRVTQLTLPQSFKTLWLTLWDEDSNQLIGFRKLRRIRKALRQAGAAGEVQPTKPESVPTAWQ